MLLYGALKYNNSNDSSPGPHLGRRRRSWLLPGASTSFFFSSSFFFVFLCILQGKDLFNLIMSLNHLHSTDPVSAALHFYPVVPTEEEPSVTVASNAMTQLSMLAY